MLAGIGQISSKPRHGAAHAQIDITALERKESKRRAFSSTARSFKHHLRHLMVACVMPHARSSPSITVSKQKLSPAALVWESSMTAVLLAVDLPMG